MALVLTGAFLVLACSWMGGKVLPSATRTVFVIAHPDDEAMFFVPTITSLGRDRAQHCYILCLSTGALSCCCVCCG
jgi:hypothetical protein